MDQKTYEQIVAKNISDTMFPKDGDAVHEVKLADAAEPKEVLINPRRLKVGYQKSQAHPFAAKTYYPVVGVALVDYPCRTETEAQAKAVTVFNAMCAEYDQKILEMTSSSPVAPEEEQVVTE